MVIMSMRPAQPQAVITKVSISALVISLPILYVSLLRLPPYTLARDTTFWFLMSNSIIAIIAADSGMLFFSSGSDADDNELSNVSSDQPAAAVQEEYIGDAPASVPLMASDEPTAVDPFHVLGGEQLPNHGVASCMVTSTGMERHGLALIRGEHASSNMDHAQVLQRCEEEAAAVLEPSTNKNCAMIPKVEEEEEEEEEFEEEEEEEFEEEEASDANKLLVEDPQMLITPPLATSGDGGDDVADKLANIDYHDALSETTEPPTSHPRMTPDDVPQDKTSTVVAREEKKPRCSATTAQEDQEREYWQLSDEELNRKVEEFITRFNRDMIEQEAGVV